MAMRKTYAAWIICFAAAAACQLALGDFPARIFAFPVNAAILLLWITALSIFFNEKPRSFLITLLSSRQTTFILLGIFTASCVFQGLSPESITGTWWFCATVLALLSHLFIVILKGAGRIRRFKARFMLNHAGIFLAIAGGFFGSPDTYDWRMPVSKETASREAIDKHGNISYPGYELRLESLSTDFYDNGVPKNYEARLTVNSEKEAVLKVNHPYRLSWMDDLYLSATDNAGGSDYCVVQITRQPWKYMQFAGILMLLAGSMLLFLQGAAATRKKGGWR